MTYTAVAKDITVLGQQFQSFLTQDGQVVFSQTSATIGLNVNESLFRRLRSSKQPESLQGNGSVFRQLKVSHSRRAISVVTMAELTMLVGILAERGHERAVSMQQASFAIMLQQSVDVAYGVERPSQEYTDRAAELALVIEKTRKELREISGRVTNPTIACNLYKINNDLVYGTGINRDRYEGDDAAQKHSKVQSLEMMQAGMKMAGMNLEDIVTKSHEFYNTKLNR